ncbi:MAG: hypothetical protein ACM3JJ_10055 [Hyphomicrobiales bacterium]
MSGLSELVDERFLMHRLRATSLAAIAGGVLAMGLFAYHVWVDHVWDWELFAIGAVMAVVKQGFMAWYRAKN